MFNNTFQNKKVIVTGDTGFKGAWLAVWLHFLGANVVGIAKDVPTKPSLFEELELADKIEHHFADIRDLKEMKHIFKLVEPDFVFHLAAQPIVTTSYKEPVLTFETNVIGTANILEALRTLDNECKAVMITSDKAYDNVEWVWGYRETDALGGKDPYSASKGAAELVIKTYFHSYFKQPDSKIKLVSTRAGNVIGGGDWAQDRIVPDCVRAWSKKEKVQVRNPQSTRPWQHVLEPLSGYLRCGQVLAENADSIHGEPFNFGPNLEHNYTVLELLQEISKHWDFGEQKEHFIINQNSEFHEAGLLKLNIDKALFYLKWRPTLTFEQTASLTGEWYNTFYNKKSDNLYKYTTDQIEDYAKKAEKLDQVWVK